MLVFLHVERVVIVPAKGHRKLKPFQAVLVRAPVGAVAHCRISVRDELVVVGSEGRPGFRSTLLENNYHEAAHQECRIGLLVIIQARVVVDLVVLVLLIIH